ncbi:hypothetical protein [Methanolapillus millepedarum]|uniref:Uncharacterized protein n=1 Tax=Methanolapillus millepedarum TaxID=3028296 RepID=A0AA96ZWF7_9EURY|nr:hypothetical protein MsAc7_14770 [Methanosarcinaceae archaeon Ac7]
MDLTYESTMALFMAFIMTIVPLLIFLVLLYFVIKKAVRDGWIEAESKNKK